MHYNIQLNLPESWQQVSENFTDESGTDISHIEAHLYDEALGRDEAMVDVYVGDMPEDSCAEDQAFSNYADIVGFDDDDPEDFNPIGRISFNNRNAFCFEALCEDDSPMICICQEPRKGVLAIICVAAKDDEALGAAVGLVERSLRIK